MTTPGGRRGVARTLAFLFLFFTPACSAHQPAAPRTGADAPMALGVAPSTPPARPRHQAAGDEPDDGDGISTPTAPASARSAAKGTPIQRGRATYYADKFKGRRTASGERYNPRALTAAHRTLPFGAVVDVVRRDGRRVRVRINDRGPFKRGRIIDLSRKAAERIGLIEDGVTQVTLELIWKPARGPR
ncbi:septal ring lytic transglycosylase RlpA family protein [Sorangium sp. So ce693]